MMYENIQNGIEKTRNGITNLRPFQRAATIGVILPTSDNLDKFLPTFLFITAVSLLDDGLKAYIGANCPSEVKSLHNRIEYLGCVGKLKDKARLMGIKEARNKYAHKPDQYATWDELTGVLANIEDELQHLGIL